MDGIPPFSCRASASTPLCRLLSAFVLTICLLLLVQAYLLEPFQVPTGSMAPTLLGHHRCGVCPRCGFRADVGEAHAHGSESNRYYERAFCPNCGCSDLHLDQAPLTQGDHVLVNKSLYAARTPRRWEVVVFRLFGKTFIKRLIGLGGEEIELIDGDIYIDGKLARKTFEEFLDMRVLVFDNDFAPEPQGWKDRWEYEPVNAAQVLPNQPLALDGRNAPQQLTYRHFSLDERKCQPIVNEYAYNVGSSSIPEPVHDFMAEAEVEVVEGTGLLSLALTDGETEVEVEIAVAQTKEVAIRVRPLEGATAWVSENGPTMRLLAGKRYHIEIALVDRRLTLRVDGQDAFAPLDLPDAKERGSVIRPLRLTAAGVLARLYRVRLYKDVHYSQVGRNAVHGRAVRLAMDDAFLLGDNSTNSEDSRFWPNQGVVPTANFVGRAFLVHLPSRAMTLQAWGRHWQFQIPDWERVRWLR